MLRLFIRFWPVLVPLIIYISWLLLARRKARKAGEEILPGIGDGPWLWAIIASLACGVLMFLFLGFNSEMGEVKYFPAHMENGKLIPGKVVKD